jgi:hypothetical protein
MLKNQYKVILLQNETYQVQVERAVDDQDPGGDKYWDYVFQGSLASCEAYIRLKDNWDVEF